MNNQYTIATLGELIAVCRDGEQGFRTCAEHARSEGLKAIFMLQGRQCADAVRELQALVRQLGGDPDARVSIVGAARRRGWFNLRAMVEYNDDAAILEACERGEDHALEVYRNALDDHLPEFVRSVVLRQFEGVMSNHDQIRDLRSQPRYHGEVAVNAGA
jgi:uncharacterized protein (TIGR02284 family)